MINWDSYLDNGILAPSHLWDDVRQTSNGYEIEIPIPGMRKEHVEISVDGQALQVKAERKEERKRALVVKRSMLLPTDADLSSIYATVEDGVLFITMNKTSRSKTQKIQVH